MPVDILFVLGGVIGGLYGIKISSKVPKIVIAIYIIIRSMSFWV